MNPKTLAVLSGCLALAQSVAQPVLAEDITLLRQQFLPANLRTITTAGSAEVFVVPDKVTVVFAVKTFDRVLSAARTVNDAARQSIVDLGQKYQIPKRDIQVTNISVEPVYEDHQNRLSTYGNGKPVGYSMMQSIGFELHKPAILNELVGDALNAGANSVSSMKYESSKFREYRDQARSNALKAAMAKANALAVESGLKLGKPIHIVEDAADVQTAVLNRGNIQSVNFGTAADFAEGEAGTALGQISIRASIRAIYEME